MDPDGSLPYLQPGDHGLLVDGEPTQVTLSNDGLWLSVRFGDVELRTRSAAMNYQLAATTEDAPMRLVQGGAIDVAADGLRPGTVLDVWLLRSTDLLGRLVVTSDGTVENAVVHLPTDVLACAQTLQLVGTARDGSAFALSFGVPVFADPYPYGDADPDGVHSLGIGCLTDRGVANGFPDGSFRADQDLTRGQLATMLARGLDLDTSRVAAFSDVTGIHAGAIAALVDLGAVGGHADGTFRPSEPVSRGQLSTILVVVLGLEPSRQIHLSEASESVHAASMNALVEAGILVGLEDGTAGAELPTSRGQVATLLARILEDLEFDGR